MHLYRAESEESMPEQAEGREGTANAPNGNPSTSDGESRQMRAQLATLNAEVQALKQVLFQFGVHPTSTDQS